jgi:hypothetical protein
MPAPLSYSEESFVSFPAEVPSPIVPPSPLDRDRFRKLVRATLLAEERFLAGLNTLSAGGTLRGLGGIAGECDRHRATLASVSLDETELPTPAGTPAALARDLYLLRLSWRCLERAAAAAGDRALMDAAPWVLAQKARHLRALESEVLLHATLDLFPQEDEEAEATLPAEAAAEPAPPVEEPPAAREEESLAES